MNKAFLKVRPERARIEVFKRELVALLDGVRPTETEEFHKNLIRDFLRRAYYEPDHFINTRGRFDLVIHHGKDNASPVGVIIEAKSPTNRAEMPSKGRLQSRAMQELLLYYLRERISAGNNRLTHLVVTNVHEWFIFDAHVFEKAFARNKQLVREFTDFEAGRLSGATTDLFYREIAAPAIREAESTLTYAWFDVREYEKPLRNADPKDDAKLIPLYKVFAPEHLLKLPFANDSNSLDRAFYTELLHIIGLHEIKEGSKRLIGRKPEGERLTGSLIENTIIQLTALDKISRLSEPQLYGDTEDDRLFNVALTLAITWVNRVLFLKLLEAQLLRYHQGDRAYRFLNRDTIPEFDDLNGLFFQVLALRQEERHPSERETFRKVPYLNSSLFEPTDLEQEMLFISNLRDNRTLPLHPRTVLRDEQGKVQRGEMSTLDYLFAFLDAYDFAGEGSEEIQEENKTLINASVLGLIFEKINGYRDGAFFTPGFVTMYMCREAIRSAVVRKFNDVKGWNCASLTDVHNRIRGEIAEANAIINSLRICDPAVGSGHFLVSALNELIAVKSELRILADTEGKVLRDYHVEVVNDELSVLDGEGRLFEYRPANRESARIQKALFHEKQILIENCLFGVDINPNSVKICRLRLWIELLKNAYYLAEDELETLPNIDINIKCGNSLISRFPLDADLRKALGKSKWNVESYRNAVQTYRGAKTRDVKQEMQRLIETIKADFRVEIQQNDPLFIRREKLRGGIFRLTTPSFIEPTEQQKRRDQAELDKLTAELAAIDAEIEEIESGRLYENAFEWRFEFPEVLNDEADFVGFDVLIGNPPYIRQEELRDLKPYFRRHFRTYAGTADLYVYFIEQGLRLLREGGEFIYIVPNKWMRGGYGKPLREFLVGFHIEQIMDFGDLPVFEEATTYPCILHLQKAPPIPEFRASAVETLDLPNGLEAWEREHRIQVAVDSLQPGGWALVDTRVQEVLSTIRAKGIPLGEYVQGKIYYGIKTGLNEAFVIDAPTRDRLIAQDPRSAEIIKPFLAGRDIKRYQQPVATRYLIFTRRGIDIEQYPAILSHLLPFKDKLMPRPKGNTDKNWPGRKPGSYEWYEIQDAIDYYEEFEKPKIVYQEIAAYSTFGYDQEGLYANNKVFIIPSEDKALLAFLNSRLAWFVLTRSANILRGALALQSPYVLALPFAEELHNHPELTNLVEQILNANANGQDTAALEAEVDRIVEGAYGVKLD